MIKLATIVCFLFISATSMAAIPTVRLINNTSCEVINSYSGSHEKIVPPVTVYTFYYNNKNRIYYSTILYDQSGNAAIGNDPNTSPTRKIISLGYSNNPNNGYGSYDGEVPQPGAHIIQWGIAGTSLVYLSIATTNPCANHSK